MKPRALASTKTASLTAKRVAATTSRLAPLADLTSGTKSLAKICLAQETTWKRSTRSVRARKESPAWARSTLRRRTRTLDQVSTTPINTKRCARRLATVRSVQLRGKICGEPTSRHGMAYLDPASTTPNHYRASLEPKGVVSVLTRLAKI